MVAANEKLAASNEGLKRQLAAKEKRAAYSFCRCRQSTPTFRTGQRMSVTWCACPNTSHRITDNSRSFGASAPPPPPLRALAPPRKLPPASRPRKRLRVRPCRRPPPLRMLTRWPRDLQERSNASVSSDDEERFRRRRTVEAHSQGNLPQLKSPNVPSRISTRGP